MSRPWNAGNLRTPGNRTGSARGWPRDGRTAVAGPWLALAAGLALAVAACGPDAGAQGEDDRAPETSTPGAEMSASPTQDTAWIALTDLSAWRGYRRSDLPSNWQVEDGTIVLRPGDNGGDIITRDQYDDFELALEWRVPPAGNSGIFYRATEDYEVIWYGAPEIQVLDDAAHPDGADPATSAGALYALYPPTEEAVRPAGEWNALRVVARGAHVEHWLNGVKIVEYEAWSDDWYDRVEASKFSEYPDFGEARSGHIGLQDHGDTVWYRDIRIRPIERGSQ